MLIHAISQEATLINGVSFFHTDFSMENLLKDNFLYSINHSRQIVRIAAKESTCVPYKKDRNRCKYNLKKLSTPLKKLCKKHSAIN